MSQAPFPPTALRVADLPVSRVTAFDLRPEAEEMRGIAADLGLSGLRKLSFKGTIRAQDRRDWLLEGMLGATVVQPCVVTLEPVTTRIDLPVRRLFLRRVYHHPCPMGWRRLRPITWNNPLRFMMPSSGRIVPGHRIYGNGV